MWVPVENDKDFIRYTGYHDNSIDTEYTAESCVEPDEQNGYEGEKEQYDLMKESVLKHDGFYVARYEASEENGKAVSKQGRSVWNYIAWGDSMSEIGTVGAVYQAQQMYTDKNTYGVTSTLIYGVQWDAIMAWIEPRYKDSSKAEELLSEKNFIADSTGKGNYNEDANTNSWRGSVVLTGSSSEYKVKNIYDLAGNVSEWTMESCYSVGRVCRGGAYRDPGYLYPISARGYRNPSNAEGIYVGFRVALYL